MPLRLTLLLMMLALVACSSPVDTESPASLTQPVLPTTCSSPSGVHAIQGQYTVTANYPTCSTTYNTTYEVSRWDIGGAHGLVTSPDVPPPNPTDPNCSCEWVGAAVWGWLVAPPYGYGKCSSARYFNCYYGPRCLQRHEYWAVMQALTADWSLASLHLTETGTGKTADGHSCTKTIEAPAFQLVGP
jgi:hypothetical protein